MGRAVLVTVPDEGAAWMVRDTLNEAGITAEIERAVPEHPYMASALARPMRVFVPEADLERARGLLAALEEELANDQEQLSAEAMAAGRRMTEPAADPARLDERALPRLSWALALGLLMPIPVVCFYARAHKLGAVFIGAFLFGMIYGPWVDFQGSEDGWYDYSKPADMVAPAVKLVDLAVGVPLVVIRRRRAARARFN